MLSRTKIFIFASIAVVAGGSVLFVRERRSSSPQFETVSVSRQDIREEVSATGQVSPAKTVSLQFENSGMVEEVFAKIGNVVKRGTALAALDTKDLEAKRLQDEAALAQANARLAAAREGSRPEDIAIVQTRLANAEIAFADAKASLDAVTAKAAEDLTKAYENSRVAYLNNLLVLGSIREDVRDIYLSPPTKFSEGDTAARVSFNNVYLITDAAYEKARTHLAAMSAFPSRQNIRPALDDLAQAAFQMSAMLDLTNRALAATDPDPATTRAAITADITSLKALLSAVTDSRLSIASTEAANTVTVQAANTSYNVAAATVANAKEDLALKQAGSRPSEISQHEAAVAEARARVAASRLALEKAKLAAPLDGIVTAVAVEVGEIVRPGTEAISLIAESRYQIDVNVPEADIARVLAGAPADVTLDAFGPDEHFSAVVSAIDPAETEVGGVVYYKVTVLFEKTVAKILPGMTANVTIFGRESKNALVIPQRAVSEKGGKKAVRVLLGEAPDVREVVTGIRSAKGEVEIVKGLAEGEAVVVFEKKR